MINLINIDKSFNASINEKKEVLSRLNFAIEEGDSISLLGANGSGKTTLLRIISGLLDVDQGAIKINDGITYDDIEMVNNNDRSFFAELTVIENLSFFLGFYFEDKLEKDKNIKILLNRYELNELSDRKYKYLSSGEKKKILLIRSILKNPKIILLDEYSSSLDFESRSQLKKLLKQLLNEGKVKAIVQVTHLLDDLDNFSNKVFILQDGKISRKISTEHLAVMENFKREMLNEF